MTLTRFTCPSCGHSIETVATARFVLCCRRAHHDRPGSIAMRPYTGNDPAPALEGNRDHG
jgi:hypothetical protein